MSNNKQKEIDENQFREAVKAYVEVDNDIKKRNTEIKDLREEKKQLELFMIDFMQKTALDEVLISDGKISIETKKNKTALKKEYIQSRIVTYTKSEDQAIKITEDIFENRPVNEKTQIKRSGVRKKRAKKKSTK